MLYLIQAKQGNTQTTQQTTQQTTNATKGATSKGAQNKIMEAFKMNEQNYNNLKANVKKAFESNTEIAKGVKKVVEHFAEDFQATIQDVLFVTMKEFTNDYQSQSVLQYYHYLGNIKRDELANMLNFLELTRQ